MNAVRRMDFLPAVSLAGLVLTSVIAASSLFAKQSPSPQKTLPVTRLVIETERPMVRPFVLRTEWIGVVESKALVSLTALIAGRVEEIVAQDQEPIEASQPVMRLGGPQVEEQRGRLAAEIGSLASRLELARQTVKRLREGLKAHLNTRDQVAAAQESQIQIEGQLRAARLARDLYEEKLSIEAPINGIFTGRRVSRGQIVASGQTVGEIIDALHLRITASLFPPPGVELQGKGASVRLDGGQVLSGRISQVLPRASRTGAVMVWIEGPKIDQLRPGQTVQGSIEVEVKAHALSVPTSAIVYDREERPVLYVEQDGAFEERQIRLGLTQDGWVEVLSGLEKNQSVVTRGAYELFYRQFGKQFKTQD